MNFLCFTVKFINLKLSDLKFRKIYNNFNAKDEVRLSPYEDDKLKELKFNKFKAYCVQVLLHYGNDKLTNMNLLKEKLFDLVGKIDEIIDLKVGFNSNETPSSYDFILNVLFKNKEDLDAYIINEDHKKVGLFVREVVETRVSIDYEV